MDLKELQAALAQNKKSTASLQGLDERYERAAALRDAPMPTAGGRYGYTSPLSAFATVLRRKRGYKQMDKVTPERNAVRQDIAGTGAILEGSALKRTIEDHKRKQQVADLGTRAEDRLGRAETRAQEALEFTKAQAKWKPQRWKNSDGDQIAVHFDPEGKAHQVDTAGNLLPMPDDQTYAPTNSSQYENRIPRTAFNRKDQDEVDELVSATKWGTTIAGQFEERFGQPFEGMPTEILNNFLLGTVNQGVVDYMAGLDPETVKNAKDARRWWAKWKYNVEIPKRHEWFGQTLTDNEQESYEAAQAMTIGSAPGEINKRLGEMNEILLEKVKDRANLGMTDPYEPNRLYWITAMEQTGVYDFDPEAGRNGEFSIKEGANSPGGGLDTIPGSGTMNKGEAQAIVDGGLGGNVTPEVMAKARATLADEPAPVKSEAVLSIPENAPESSPGSVGASPSGPGVDLPMPSQIQRASPEVQKNWESLTPEQKARVIEALPKPANPGGPGAPVAGPRSALPGAVAATPTPAPSAVAAPQAAPIATPGAPGAVVPQRPRALPQATGGEPSTPSPQATGLPQAAGRVEGPVPTPTQPIRRPAPVQPQALPGANPPRQGLERFNADTASYREQYDDGSYLVTNENLEINRYKAEEQLKKLEGMGPEVDDVRAVIKENIAGIDKELARRNVPLNQDRTRTKKMIAQYPKGRPKTQAEFDKLPGGLKIFYFDHLPGKRSKDGMMHWKD